MAEALLRLGCHRALVVHGSDGSDEITPTGPTRAIELNEGRLSVTDIDPSDYGVAACTVADLTGGSAADNAQVLRAILGGARGPCADATALNAGAALYVAGLGDSIRRVAITPGARGRQGRRVLDRYVLSSGRPRNDSDDILAEKRREIAAAKAVAAGLLRTRPQWGGGAGFTRSRRRGDEPSSPRSRKHRLRGVSSARTSIRRRTRAAMRQPALPVSRC
jgi:hypothetical protein